MPTIEELTKKYDEFYQSDKGKWSVTFLDRLAYDAITTFAQPEEVLDVGCGNGHTLDYFRQRHMPAKFYGLDISSAALELAKSKLPEAEFYLSDITQFTSRKRWQVIVSLETIECLIDPDAGLAKIKSLLKKGGIAYIAVPDNLVYSRGEHNLRPVAIGDKRYEWHLTRKEWETKLIDAGFTIRKAYTNVRPAWRFSWFLE